MENLALLSTKLPTLAAPPKPADILNRQRPCCPILAVPTSRMARIGGQRRPRSHVVSAFRRGSSAGAPQKAPDSALEKLEMQGLASISSSRGSEVSAISGSQQLPVPPPPSNIGSPLFWIGVGVGLSALFSVVATKIKAYAMQQFFKTMMNQPPQNSQFSNSAFSPGSQFPFAAALSSFQTATSSAPAAPQPVVASQPVVTVDVPATNVEVTSPTEVRDETATTEPKKYAFVDISPEEVSQKDFEYSEGSTKVRSTENIHSEKQVPPNGAAFKQDKSVSNDQSQSRGPKSVMSVEALEKMMEDPTVQKMVYPYLPEEMRNPTSFKWMLQNPPYRQQLEDMLNNMGGSSEWDSRMMESLKNFDLSSPEVKQQFDQIGLTPEEVISKIMANPEVALAFQNPKVQAAIMDCSQNPLSIMKYQNDKEVMDVFNKISELFPGMSP